LVWADFEKGEEYYSGESGKYLIVKKVSLFEENNSGGIVYCE